MTTKPEHIYLPSDPDALRDGLLRGWFAHIEIIRKALAK